MSDAGIIADLKPCGYVLATHDYKFFSVQCIFCHMKIGHWPKFISHLKEQHKIREVVEFFEMDSNFGDCEKAVNEEDGENIVIDLIESPVKTKATNKSSSLLKDEICKDAGSASHLVSELASVEPTVDENFDLTDDRETQEKQENPFEIIEQLSKHGADYEIESEDKLLQVSEDVDELSNTNKSNFNSKPSFTLKLIELYQRYPCIWDPDHPDYEIASKQTQALKALMKDLLQCNFFVSLTNLKEIIGKIDSIYLEISSRQNEGQDISTHETKFIQECSYLISLKKEKKLISSEEYDDVELNSTSDEDEEMSVDTLERTEKDYLMSESEDDENNLKYSNKFIINLGIENKSTSDFIDCYAQHPCLWDPNHADYNNSENRIQAIMQIKNFFQKHYHVSLTDKRLKNAIKRLHVFYKLFLYTKRKISKTRKYYFERCSFLSGIELDDRIQIKNISSNKITFGDTDKFTLDFIGLLKNHPVLWDTNHQSYSLISERTKAYEQISQHLQEFHAANFSREELYDGMYRLKQYYYSIQDKERKNEPLTKSDLIYLENCKFLPPCKRKIQCHICERVLRSSMTLQTHLLKEHNIGELPHKCGYCEQRFAHRTAAREHEVRTHTKLFEWFCKHCNKGFANRRDMELHELVHTGERNSICEHCGKGFRLKHQMTEHVKIVHERLRRFKCTMCPKDFLRKTHLDDHVRGHLNIRDKVCDICGKAFTNFHSLFRHKQIHAEVKKYSCKVCGERFHQYVGLNAHMKGKHKILNQPNTTSTYVLNVTDK